MQSSMKSKVKALEDQVRKVHGVNYHIACKCLGGVYMVDNFICRSEEEFSECWAAIPNDAEKVYKVFYSVNRPYKERPGRVLQEWSERKKWAKA